MGCEPQNPASERLEKGGSIGQREYVKLGSRGSHRDDFDRDRPGPILFLIGGCVLVFLALGGRRSGGDTSFEGEFKTPLLTWHQMSFASGA